MKLHLFYLITFTPKPALSYFVQVGIAPLAKPHGYQDPQFITHFSQLSPEHVSLEDHEVLEILSPLRVEEGGISYFPLEGKQGAFLLEQLIKTGHAHFANVQSPPLKLGKKQTGRLNWINEPHGKQRLHCWISGGANTILPLKPLWYIDSLHHEAGELETSLDAETAAILLSAPSLRTEEIREIYNLLKTTENKDLHKTLKAQLQKMTAPLEEKNIDAWYCDWKEVSHKPHWFDVEVGIEHEGSRINLLPLFAELIQSQLSLHSIETLLKLPDDKTFTLTIPPHRTFIVSMKRLKKILLVFAELYKEDAFFDSNTLRVSAMRALQLSQLQESLGVKHFKWYGDITLPKLVKKFNHFKKNQYIPLPLPDDFCGELRPYQQRGVYWLQFLRETGFSGILADDMGLGKTVQVLAHLLLEKFKKPQKEPALIITHTSLTLNWQREAQRFTPRLSVLVLQGQWRHEHFPNIANYDVVISTYPLLIRDEEILAQQKYSVLVLDEAQTIKNVYSKAGQVARSLTAEQRLCLTGTPLENHLGELWSLFHFLLPGLLGEKKQFHQLFRVPIEKEHNSERLQSLKQRIFPFFLRRIKQEVLPELPEKIEMLRPVELTAIQTELYENIRVALHQKVLLAISEKGVARSQIYILNALLKLRQVCCDPRLLKNTDEIYEETSSAKLQLLSELLPTLILEGRRILLFSQFTEMLSLIEETVKSLKIKYLLLTGKTENRDTLIQKFQEGDIPLFLISLKAGGVGLNLTKADTVIHYDPWWNPAVENQATDRAHRIGQDKSVFVYKLITSHTIEEKIMALQQEKKSLFEVILAGDQQSLEKFSAADIENLFAPLE